VVVALAGIWNYCLLPPVLIGGNASLKAGPMADLREYSTRLATGAGRERTEADYADLLNSAGFRLERIIPTTSTTSLIEAIPV